MPVSGMRDVDERAKALMAAWFAVWDASSSSEGAKHHHRETLANYVAARTWAFAMRGTLRDLGLSAGALALVDSDVDTACLEAETATNRALPLGGAAQ